MISKKEFVQIQTGKDYKTTVLSRELSHLAPFKFDDKLMIKTTQGWKWDLAIEDDMITIYSRRADTIR